MRYEHALYIIATLCFILAALLLAASLLTGYLQDIEVTPGNRLLYVVLMILLTVLGLIFAIISYVTRAREIKPVQSSTRRPLPPPKPTEAPPTKRSLKIKPPSVQLKLTLPNVVSLSMLGMGITALTVSITFSSSILAFVGLGLTFWGALFLYIKTEKLVKEPLLDKTAFPSLLTLNQMLTELGFKGQAIYLPPAYLKDFESSKVFVAKQEDQKLPTAKQIQTEEEKIFVTRPEGVLLTPPGADLAKLFENMLGTTFTRVDLPYLQANLPRLIIEDLEIAENFEMETHEHRVAIQMENSIYRNMHLEAMKHPEVQSLMACPICSAIACAIAKAAGMPIMIEKEQTREEGRTMIIEYRLLSTHPETP